MKALRTISPICLAVLVLVSSSSFVVNAHFCGNSLESVSLFSPIGGCESKIVMPPCHKPAKHSCCDDKTIVHESQDLKAASTQIHLSTVFAVEPAQSQVFVSEIIPSYPLSVTTFFDDDSPLPSPDLTISLRVFLI
jgi:hypothetical protein